MLDLAFGLTSTYALHVRLLLLRLKLPSQQGRVSAVSSNWSQSMLA
jgi:hypothetical protein